MICHVERPMGVLERQYPNIAALQRVERPMGVLETTQSPMPKKGWVERPMGVLENGNPEHRKLI